MKTKNPRCPRCDGSRLLVEHTAVMYVTNGEMEAAMASDLQIAPEALAHCATGNLGEGCGWSGPYDDTLPAQTNPFLTMHCAATMEGGLLTLEDGTAVDLNFIYAKLQKLRDMVAEIRRYDDRLNEKELPPDGDTYNDILDIVGRK